MNEKELANCLQLPTQKQNRRVRQLATKLPKMNALNLFNIYPFFVGIFARLAKGQFKTDIKFVWAEFVGFVGTVLPRECLHF